MTVIAFDGLTLASDSASASPSGTINRVCKAFMVEPTDTVPHLGVHGLFLFGVEGCPQDAAKVGEFLRGERERLNLKGRSRALIVAPGGNAWLWQGSRPVPLITGAKAAIGSGAKAALGAMFAGANAVRAVEIATAVVAGCEGPVQAFSLPGPVEVPEVGPTPELVEVEQ